MTGLRSRPYNTMSGARPSSREKATMTAHSNPTRTQTVAVETHGCKLNQADSSVVAAEFVRAGFRIVSTREPADIYVVNSCTVTHVADRKARRAIRAASADGYARPHFEDLSRRAERTLAATVEFPAGH